MKGSLVKFVTDHILLNSSVQHRATVERQRYNGNNADNTTRIDNVTAVTQPVYMFSIQLVCLLPCKALREEGQTAKNLCTLVELLHIRRCYHCDAVVVQDTVVVHAQAITHCNVTGQCCF